MDGFNYSIFIPEEMVLDYFERLKDKFFKILPIYEGKAYNSSTIIYNREQAMENYLKYLDNFLLEMIGNCNIFPKDETLVEFCSLLQGLKTLDENNHEKVKSIVFKCRSKCERLVKNHKK